MEGCSDLQWIPVEYSFIEQYFTPHCYTSVYKSEVLRFGVAGNCEWGSSWVGELDEWSDELQLTTRFVVLRKRFACERSPPATLSMLSALLSVLTTTVFHYNPSISPPCRLVFSALSFIWVCIPLLSPSYVMGGLILNSCDTLKLFISALCLPIGLVTAFMMFFIGVAMRGE